jgi:hypothetical protein
MTDGQNEPTESGLRILGISHVRDSDQAIENVAIPTDTEGMSNAQRQSSYIKNEEEIDEEQQYYDLHLPVELYLAADMTKKAQETTSAAATVLKAGAGKGLSISTDKLDLRRDMGLHSIKDRLEYIENRYILNKIAYFKKFNANAKKPRIILPRIRGDDDIGPRHQRQLSELLGSPKTKTFDIKQINLSPKMDEVMVNHLSPNRYLQMYFVGKASGKPGAILDQYGTIEIMDHKASEIVHRILGKFRTNILMTMQRLREQDGSSNSPVLLRKPRKGRPLNLSVHS